MGKLICAFVFTLISFSCVFGQNSVADVSKPTSVSTDSSKPSSVEISTVSEASVSVSSSIEAHSSTSSPATEQSSGHTSSSGSAIGVSTTAPLDITTQSGTTEGGTSTNDPVETTSVPPVPPTTDIPSGGPGNWSVEGNQTKCIVINMAAHFQIAYTMKNSTNATYSLVLPKTATVDQSSSYCGEKDATLQSLVLDFGGSVLQMDFAKSDNKVFIQNITLKASLVDAPDAQQPSKDIQLDNLHLFEVVSSHSYKCNKEQSIDSKTSDKLIFSDLHYEAFRTVDNLNFAIAEDCDNDLGDIVPIAVGCALAALVVIVLIAYLVGRRHKRQKGYESV